MFLKLVERDNKRNFVMIEVTSVSFRRLEESRVIYKERGTSTEIEISLSGNAFILNDVGDTIESFITTR